MSFMPITANLPGAHFWVFPVPCAIDITRNEDGVFQAKVPHGITLDGADIQIDSDHVKCLKCGVDLQYGWGVTCDGQIQ